jgi:FtsH-binding integral membrane protein
MANVLTHLWGKEPKASYNGLSAEQKRSSTKFLALMFGYMFLALVLSGMTSLLFSYELVKAYPPTVSGSSVVFSEAGSSVFIITCVVALIVMVVDVIVFGAVNAKHGSLPVQWLTFGIFAVCMGLFLSVFMLMGIDFGTMAEAFGISALTFGVMFLVGWLTPVRLNPVVFALISFLTGVLLIALIFGIWYLLTPSSAVSSYNSSVSQRSAILINAIISLVILVIALLATAVDAGYAANAAQSGAVDHSTAMSYAFSLYIDFIVVFVRVLILLLAAKDAKGTRNG